MATQQIRSGQILDGTITNADLSATAAIGWSKIDTTGASLSSLGSSGTNNRIAKWIGTGTIADSILSESNGGDITLTAPAGARGAMLIAAPDGTTTYATVRVTAGTVIGQLVAYPQSYVTTGGGYDVPNSLSFLTHGSNGLSIVTTHPSGAVKIYSGSTNTFVLGTASGVGNLFMWNGSALANVVRAGSAGNNFYTGGTLSIVNKADTAVIAQINDSGSLFLQGSFFERGRSVAMGEWTPFTPTLTTNNGTWTAGAGYVDCKYTLVGKIAFVSLDFENTTLSLAPTLVSASLPVSLVPQLTLSWVAWFIDAAHGGWVNDAFVQVALAQGNRVDIYRFSGPFAAGGSFYIRVLIMFPIS